MEICLTVVLVVTLPVKKLNGNVEMGIAVLDLSLRKNWSPDGTQKETQTKRTELIGIETCLFLTGRKTLLDKTQETRFEKMHLFYLFEKMNLFYRFITMHLFYRKYRLAYYSKKCTANGASRITVPFAVPGKNPPFCYI